jgi:hemerythrin-like domain-containing protein
MQAIRIILDEHRSIAAVLHGMLHLIRDIRLCGTAPDFAVLESMVRYIDTFVERFHHPKEDAHLFQRLRVRYPGCATLVDRLESEHREGTQMLGVLETTLACYEAAGTAAFGPFAQAVQAYAAFHWNHMRSEDDEMLPLTRTHLTPLDWQDIDDAFTDHADPLSGLAARECAALFRRIVTLAPPPIGVGPLPQAQPA